MGWFWLILPIFALMGTMKHQLKWWIFSVVFLLVFRSFAQPFSNVWVNTNQSYKKIKIAKEGVYKIDFQKIINCGLPSNLDPRNIQLFCRGVEVPLYAEGQNDGVLDPNDYFLFHGTPNDGWLDSNLYVPKSSQPHPFVSLYTDTSYYFLTIGNQPGLRFQDYDGSNTSGNPELFYFHTVTRVDTNSYYLGVPYFSNYFSEMGEGEGWMGQRVQVVNNPTAAPVRQDVNFSFSFSTPFKSTQAVPCTLDLQFFGVSNADVSNVPSGNNHHIQVKQGTTVLLDTLFYGLGKVKRKFILPNLVNNPSFTLSIIDDQNLAVDAIAFNYAQLTYPRTFDMSDTTQRKFSFDGSGNSTYLRFSPFKNAALASPMVFDIQQRFAIRGSIVGNSFNTMLPGTGNGFQYYIFDFFTHPLLIDSLLPTRMVNYSNPINPQYLIIYHPSLQGAAISHATYRSSIQGGAYRVALINILELYDQFSYGIPHPLAIRNYVHYLFGTQVQSPEFLLLVGKGYVSDYVRKPRGNLSIQSNLIPTIGNPASDVLLTSGLGTSRLEPALPTGRISARTNAEADYFLSKIRQTESMPPSVWQKQVALITGAKSAFELNDISQYQNAFFDSIQGIPFGAYSYKVEKNTTLPVSNKLKGEIINKVNQGVGILSYFGHGSTNTLAIDIGQPIEYSNQGKYPFMIFNGCYVGNAFEDNSLGEKFTLANQIGASGWLAHSYLGLVPYLGDLSKRFFGSVQRNYGQPVGIHIQNAMKSFQGLGGGYEKIHIQQAIFQGDPAMRISSPSKPDFSISSSDIYLNPDPANALMDSISLNIWVSNAGKSTTDSINIHVGRKVENGIDTFGFPLRIKPPLNQGLFSYTFRSPSPKYQGNNQFTIIVDSVNEVDELDNWVNNRVVYKYFLPGNGISVISPNDFDIIGNDTLKIILQYSDLKNISTPAIVEFDTVPSFNSPYFRRFLPTSTNNLIEINHSLVGLNDSLVFFLRAKLDLPDSAGGYWIYRTFTRLIGQKPGWSQSHPEHWKTLSMDSILFSTSKNWFVFDSLPVELKILMERFATSGRGVYVSGKQPPGSGSVNGAGACSGRNLIVADFNGNTLEPSYYLACGSTTNYRSYMAFNMSISSDRTRFVDHLMHTIPKGNFVCVSSYYPGATNRPFIQVRNWNDSVMNALAIIGADTNVIRGVTNDSTSIGIIGRKGWSIGLASFASLLDTNIANVGMDTLGLTRIVKIPFSKGRISSIPIGPVKQWDSFTWAWKSLDTVALDPKKSGYDSVSVSIIGIDTFGQETLLLGPFTDSVIYLNSISAQQYPKIKFVFEGLDSVDFSSPQLKIWSVNFQPLMEGSVLAGNYYKFYSDSIQEGDSIGVEYGFKNLGNETLRNYQIRFRLTDANRNSFEIFSETLDSVLPSEVIPIKKKFSTKGRVGTNSLELSVLPNQSNDERILSNNYSKDRFVVLKDRKAPLLEVELDQRPLVNQEIVSPNPIFVLRVTDENPYFTLSDTSRIKVFLKYPGAFEFEPMYFSSGNLILNNSGKKNVAEASFMPKKLSDGWYELKVDGFDYSENTSGKVSYQSSFQVINKASVSNFFPYPNPFSSQTKFVFTLTGTELPDEMSIQIFSISGRLVREIKQSEIGPLRIGNNITSFAWDGTDQFGDRLGNGVYFYRVLVRQRGEKMMEFKTSGDRFFKNGMGKIYLMR
jgi:hypothetical protein